MGTSATHEWTPPLIVRAVKRMANVKVVIGKFDHYDPATKTIHLRPETIQGADPNAIFRACHEAGHARQHSINSWLWRMRTEWFPVITGLWGVTLIAGAVFWWINALMALSLHIVSLVLWLARALIIVETEREASEIALDWLDENFAPEDKEMREGKAHLDSHRKSYWRVLIGL